MTNAKHTPGPWGKPCALSSDMYNIRYITGPDCQKICDVNHRVEMTQEEALANARLIAAAPDLLEAVRWAADFLTEMQEDAHAARFAELVRKVEQP